MDTRLDGPLLALVRRGRDQIARLKLLRLATLLGVIMMVSGVALNPDAAAIGRTAFFGVLVASWTATVERRSRPLARLEGRLRSRSPRLRPAVPAPVQASPSPQAPPDTRPSA